MPDIWFPVLYSPLASGKRDRYKAEIKLKEDMRQEILSLLNSEGIAAYVLLKEHALRLNKGNFYAFLRGKTDSMTVSAIYDVLKHLKSKVN